MFKSKSIVSILLAVLLLTVLVGCQASAAKEKSVPTAAEQVPRIEPQDLKALLDEEKEVVVVDTRRLGSYEASHIPGSISIPLAEMETRYQELPKDARIILYCA
jgi:3-mercaptopyruvate sulfurtransferase SseA